MSAASKTSVKVGIVEDDPDTLAYLWARIRTEDGFSVSFAANTLSTARADLSRTVPDICLVDLRLPDGHGTEFIREVRRDHPACAALVLTSLADRDSVLGAFEAGASGYILKDSQIGEICRNIHAVTTGGNPISPQAATHLIAMMAPAATASETTLTDREHQVLTLFAKGMSYDESADIMGISAHTIRGYVKAVYKKLSVHSRNEAIYEAVQKGWLRL